MIDRNRQVGEVCCELGFRVRQRILIRIPPDREGGRQQEQRQQQHDICENAPQIDRDVAENVEQALRKQIIRMVADMLDARHLAGAQLAGEGKCSRRSGAHGRRHRGADVAAAGDARQIVDFFDEAARGERLYGAEAKGRRADAAAGQREPDHVRARLRPHDRRAVTLGIFLFELDLGPPMLLPPLRDGRDLERKNFMEFLAGHCSPLSARRGGLSAILLRPDEGAPRYGTAGMRVVCKLRLVRRSFRSGAGPVYPPPEISARHPQRDTEYLLNQRYFPCTPLRCQETTAPAGAARRTGGGEFPQAQ